MNWKEKIATIWHDQSGAAVVEYGLILALIFLVFVGAAQTLGATFLDQWTKTSDSIVAAIGS